jgi:membrane fusion protein (multidrug efflux system)
MNAVVAWRKPLIPSRRTQIVCSLLAFAGVALAGCEPPPQQFTPPPAEVAALEVQPRDLPLSLEYAAQLRGVREVEVRARVSGILLEKRYVEGQPVKAGDLLFRIDPDPFRAEVARTRANLGVQQALFSQARRERDRILPLYDQKLASLRDRDTAVAQFESTQANVAAAQAALQAAELSLSYTEVRAPIAGLTSREVRSEGSLVTAGNDSSLLTYIVQADRLYVDISLPEADASLVREAYLAAPESVAVRVVDTRGKQTGPAARIEFIAPRVDDATGTIALRAVLDNAANDLIPGRVVRARIDGVSVASALVIPKRALMHGAQGAFVWAIGQGEMVEPRPVQLGASSGNDVVVASGLERGTRIVVDGLLKVQPGAPVHATPLAADGSAPPAPNSPGAPAGNAAGAQ